jgi:hypothetical protein
MSRKEVVQLIPGDKVVEQSKDVIIIEREVPLLDYQALEGNFKHLQGKILTIVEASIIDRGQLEAVKSLIKSAVNDKLTWMFDLYGHSTDQEVPAYSEVGKEIK